MTNQYLAAYNSQRSRAKTRGIGWELTFKQWIDFWGDDLPNRGVGPTKLCMQRRFDTGPYALGNISKGVAKQNARTHANMECNRSVSRAEREHQKRLDAMMWEPSAPSQDYDEDEAYEGSGTLGSCFPKSYHFAREDGKSHA